MKSCLIVDSDDVILDDISQELHRRYGFTVVDPVLTMLRFEHCLNRGHYDLIIIGDGEGQEATLNKIRNNMFKVGKSVLIVFSSQIIRLDDHRMIFVNRNSVFKRNYLFNAVMDARHRMGH